MQLRLLIRFWNYAHVLRDDGVGCGDYVEQITYLIFLKMADERERGDHHERLSIDLAPLAGPKDFVPLCF